MALNTRITHAVREVLREGDPNVRITHTLREVLRTGDPSARITHTVREVLRAVATSGWTGKICGVVNPSKICGVLTSDIGGV